MQLVKHIIQLWLLCDGGFPLLYLLILIALVTLGEDIIHDRCHRVAIHGFLQRIFTASAGIKNNEFRSRCTVASVANADNKVCSAIVLQLDDNRIVCLNLCFCNGKHIARTTRIVAIRFDFTCTTGRNFPIK